MVKPLVGGRDVLVDVGDALAAVGSVALAQTQSRVGHLGSLVVNVLRLVEMLRLRILVSLILLPEAPVTDGAVQRHGHPPRLQNATPKQSLFEILVRNSVILLVLHQKYSYQPVTQQQHIHSQNYSNSRLSFVFFCTFVAFRTNGNMIGQNISLLCFR